MRFWEIFLKDVYKPKHLRYFFFSFCQTSVPWEKLCFILIPEWCVSSLEHYPQSAYHEVLRKKVKPVNAELTKHYSTCSTFDVYIKPNNIWWWFWEADTVEDWAFPVSVEFGMCWWWSHFTVKNWTPSGPQIPTLAWLSCLPKNVQKHLRNGLCVKHNLYLSRELS